MTKSLAPFQVSCPSCSAEYPVDPDRVPPGGVHAVCSSCLRTFPVTVPEEEWAPPETPPFQADPEPEAEGAAWDEPLDAAESVAPPTPEPEVDAGVAAEAEEEPEIGTDFVWEQMDQPPQDAAAAAGLVEEITEEEEDSLEDLSNLASEALREADEEADRPRDGASLSLGAARFGRRDPHDRAKRLARVLVSDIIAYYPEKHAEAVLRGTVKADFAEEVEKSRKEYVDQVGKEMANSTPYFREALNEVLARGSEVY